MSAHAAAHATHGTHDHHDLGFLRTYVFSTDHKTIGRQFLILGLLMMILGGLLATAVRADTIALVGGTVHPVSGPDVANGPVVIRDGKIAKTFHMENWLSAIGKIRRVL